MSIETYQVAMIHLNPYSILDGCVMRRYRKMVGCLTTESVKGLSLTLERIDDIHGYNILTAGMLSVGNTVTDEVLKEDLKDSDQRDGG